MPREYKSAHARSGEVGSFQVVEPLRFNENLRFNERKYRMRSNFFSKCSSLHYLSTLGSRFFIFTFIVLLKIAKTKFSTAEKEFAQRKFTLHLKGAS